MTVTFKDLLARREQARLSGDRLARDAFDLMIAHLLDDELLLACYAGTNPTLRAVRGGEPLEY